MRTLVGAVGYRNLRDHSVQFEILDRLQREPPGPDVIVEDTSYNPIAVVQWLEGEIPQNRFERVIFVAAVERGRIPGAITAYRWDGTLPSEDQIQQAVAEAVTGVIALENTIVIAGYFGVLPAKVVVVEVEPVDHDFGSQLSADVESAVEPACQLIRSLTRDHAAFDSLPARPLPARHVSKARV